MKKRTGKMISLSLAVAMAVTAAPVTALADENTQGSVIEASELTPVQNAGETETDTTTEGDETGTGTTTEGDETEAGKEVTSMVLLTSATPVDEQSTETTLKSTGTVGNAEDLTYALENAEDGEETTITLSNNIEGDFTVAENKNIVLDLNGYTIKNTSDHTITNNGTLTIKDSSEDKAGTIDNVTHEKAAVWNNGDITLESGRFIRSEEAGVNSGNNGGNSFYTLLNHGTMIVKDGVYVENKGKYSSMFENGWQNGNDNTSGTNSSLLIEGGTFSGGLNTIKNDDYGELTINGGTFTNMAQAAFLNWNVATVNGGTFEAKEGSNAIILNGYGNATMDKGELTINGGSFNTEKTSVNFIKTMYTKKDFTSGTIEVNGGNIYGDIQLSDVTEGATLSIANGVTINGNITNGGVANVDVTNATVTGSVSNAGTGSIVISDGATVKEAVSNTGSGSMAVIESRIGRYTPGQNITFVDSTTTSGETIENTQDVSAACARIDAKYYDTLKEALTESISGDTITLVKDVTVSNTQDMANSNYNEAVITLKDGVTLDGDTHTIYADKNWFKSTEGNNAGKPANHIVGVSGVSATIKNLTIVGNANTKHGINAFGTNGTNGTNTLIVNNVTIKNCGTAGMVINGAKVTATNINTEGNPWGAINVDKSSGSELDLTGGTFKENVQIWTESDDPNISLDGVQLDEVTGEGTNLKGYTYFTDDVSKLGAAYNETTKTIYESLAEALTAAQSGNTISVVKDTELTAGATVDNNVTLVVNPGVTLSISENATLTNNGTIENKGEIKGEVTGEITEYYTVTFTSNKEIESVEVKDEKGGTVEPNVEGKFVYSLADGKYTYTMETVRGTRTGSFTVDGEELTINERFSSGGSSHSYDGYITIINPKNGEVSVSDDWAYEDDKITLTITPDDGYEVDKIEIVDDEGDKIDAKKVDDEDNKYTFRMANCDVTVTVTFKEEGKTTEDTDKEEDKDDEETTELNFTDVKESDWFFKGVEYVVDKDIMSGVSENEFAPAGKLTRAMLVQMLYNMESRPACDAENAFMDVPVGQWYTDAVIWANDAKIVSGMGEGLFAPNMEITREQMVAMLYNYAKYKGYDVTASADLSAFADTASVSAWAQPAMQWAVAEGYISGMGDSQLAPQGTATRAEIASVIMRFMEATAESAETAE